MLQREDGSEAAPVLLLFLLVDPTSSPLGTCSGENPVRMPQIGCVDATFGKVVAETARGFQVLVVGGDALCPEGPVPLNRSSGSWRACSS